jgi:hypothetical protein
MSWDLAAPPVPGDVQGALKELGIDVLRVEHGEIWARCPAHRMRTGKDDRHPSFSVNEERGIFLCFSCGYQGAFPVLVADAFGMEPAAAEAWVRRYGGLERAKRTLARLGAPAAFELAPAEPSLAAFTQPPPDALAQRRLDPDAAARFGVLWDPKSGGWVLPIRDRRGVLLGYQFKRGAYVRNRPRGVPKSRTLFGLHAFEGDTAVLVESPLDCARLWAAGVPGALASYGAVVSDEQIDLLVHAADRVVIALDNPATDEAGALGGPLVEARLRGRVKTVLYLAYPDRPKVKDPGDMTDLEIGDGVDGAYSSLKRRLAAL